MTARKLIPIAPDGRPIINHDSYLRVRKGNRSLVGRFYYLIDARGTWLERDHLWWVTILLPGGDRVFNFRVQRDVEIEEISEAEYFLALLKYEDGCAEL